MSSFNLSQTLKERGSLDLEVQRGLNQIGWTPSVARRISGARGDFSYNMRMLAWRAGRRDEDAMFRFYDGPESFLPQYELLGRRYVCTRAAYTPWRYANETLGLDAEASSALFNPARTSPRRPVRLNIDRAYVLGQYAAINEGLVNALCCGAERCRR